MHFTDRELKLILLALNNTSSNLQTEARLRAGGSGAERIQLEATDMDKIWRDVFEELTEREHNV
jgi:hypothetical protein|tara:strand:- start:3854 stop:4045 length:192 start_codon:yes stop_codon:yes gene_type:complete